MSPATCLLALAGLCGAGTSLAQQAPIAPLLPVVPVVAPLVPRLGVPLQPNQPASSTLATTAASAARPQLPEPVWLLNSRYIMSGGMLSGIKPLNIAKIDIYKAANLPAQLTGLTENGIVDVTLKTQRKLKAKSLAAIKRRLALAGPVSFELDGQPLGMTSLRVATEAIAVIEVTRAEVGTTVNIRLTHSNSISHPPGTILIRGLAGN